MKGWIVLLRVTEGRWMPVMVHVYVWYVTVYVLVRSRVWPQNSWPLLPRETHWSRGHDFCGPLYMYFNIGDYYARNVAAILSMVCLRTYVTWILSGARDYLRYGWVRATTTSEHVRLHHIRLGYGRLGKVKLQVGYDKKDCATPTYGSIRLMICILMGG